MRVASVLRIKLAIVMVWFARWLVRQSYRVAGTEVLNGQSLREHVGRMH